MKGRLVLLGTGGSTGVPMIGCRCAVCTSGLERLRPSALVEVAGKRFLIDAGPDFRLQALRYGIDRLDGVLITHAHYDHIGGLEEMRVYHFFEGTQRMPLLLNQETFESLSERLRYLMEEQSDGEVLSSRFAFHRLNKRRGSVTFEGVRLEFFTYSQLEMSVVGYRFGDLAYVSDIKEYDDDVFEALSGVKTLVLDALKEEENRAHFSLAEGVGFAKKCGVERVYFTHLAHEVDERRLKTKLPGNAELAHDGLELEFEI